MKKYLITAFLLLTSISPTTNSAQSSEKDTIKQPQTSEIELMVDSLATKKEEIIEKAQTLKKLEEELNYLKAKQKKIKLEEERQLKKDLEEIDELMKRREIY